MAEEDLKISKKRIEARNETDAIIDAYDRSGHLIIHTEEEVIK